MLNPPYISFRIRPAGGDVRRSPKIVLSGLQRRRRIILLIHGFNTTSAEAQEAYEAFTKLLERSAPRLWKSLCPVYWPGDSHLKAGGYPWLVRRAEECGSELAHWIH